MRTLRAPRRIRNSLVALLAGVSAAAVPTVIAPSQAAADSFTGLADGKAAVCYYRGAAYSEGAVEEMEGGKYSCSKDGTWAYIGPKDEPVPEEPKN
jgi:hypothetical protein